MKLDVDLVTKIIFAINSDVDTVEIQTPEPMQVVVDYEDCDCMFISLGFDDFDIIADKQGTIVEVSVLHPGNSDVMQEVQKVLNYLTGE